MLLTFRDRVVSRKKDVVKSFSEYCQPISVLRLPFGKGKYK